MVLFIFKSQRKHLEMPRDKVTERSLDRTTACGKVAFFCDRMHCLTRLPTFLIEALGFPLLFGFVWLVHLKFRSVPLWLCVLSFRSTNSWTLQLNEQCVCWTRLIERCSLKELHSRWISPADEFVAHHRCTNLVAWILPNGQVWASNGYYPYCVHRIHRSLLPLAHTADHRVGTTSKLEVLIPLQVLVWLAECNWKVSLSMKFVI